MSTTAFEIDFETQNIRARLPCGSRSAGELVISTGFLVEGEIHGDLTVAGDLVLLETGSIIGKCVVQGNCYILGNVKAERLEVNGVVHIGKGAVVGGYMLARDYKLYAGSDVSASLHKMAG